jgi:high-affinity iron transporter
MTQIAISIFREILEIALIIGILAAATKNISKRNSWLILGLLLGIAGSVSLAFATDFISSLMNNLGQDIFNGIILIITSLLIAWTVLWMKKNSQSLVKNLRNVAKDINEGNRHSKILTFIVALSTLREGAEIVLYLYSQYLAETDLMTILSGFLAGLIAGIATGFALYFGILKTSGKYFLNITAFLLIFFSAGILSNGIGFWNNANIIPAIIDPIFDLSDILPQNSVIGRFLNSFFGYIDKPTATQLIGYLLMIAIIYVGMSKIKKTQK